MGVIEPDDRAGIIRSWTGAFWDFPYVSMSLARRHGVVFLLSSGCSVVVGRAFGVFVIEHSVGMHAVGSLGVVLENDLDRVANFGAENWTKNSCALPFGRPWSQLGE